MKTLTRIIAVLALAVAAVPAARADAYLATDLVSDQPGVATHQDPHLVNGWGIALNPNGGAFWVSSEGVDLSTLYAGDVNGSPLTKPSLEVAIPGGHPTGLVFNPTTDFVVTSGTLSGPATFIFASTTGLVTGWNQGVSRTEAQIGFSAEDGAIYTGIALAKNGTGNFLYLADFHNGEIDVLDGTFHLVHLAGGFEDPGLPSDYAPFNIAALDGRLYVAYARQDADAEEEITGQHLGFVDVFDSNGAFERRLVSQGNLNAPWAMVIAPSEFGEFGGDLLVGNFGDGRINAYDPATGDFAGRLGRSPERPIEIDGLWGLAFGNGLTAGDAATLYYAAGPDDETHGLFGKITANPPGTSPVHATLTGGNLVIAGSRDDDRIDLQEDPDGQQIVVLASDEPIGSFDVASVSRIQFQGFAGDDRITIAKTITIPAVLDGGAGDDSIGGGDGNNVLLGGPAADILVGSGARDILIGGDGPDHLRGLGDDDLIIGGMTSYDGSIPALMEILAVWTSTDSYAARIDQLRNGTGGVPIVDVTTVVDDGADDMLFGNQELDWFFAGADDGPVDERPEEQVN